MTATANGIAASAFTRWAGRIATMNTPMDARTAKTAERETEAVAAIAMQDDGKPAPERGAFGVVHCYLDREWQQHARGDAKLNRVGRGAEHPIDRSPEHDFGVSRGDLVQREAWQHPPQVGA